MANILVFDTETTGLPSKRNANPKDFKYFDSARLVQIAWSVHSTGGDLISKECYIVKPNGFVIKNSEFHGITQEMALSAGVEFGTVYEKFAAALGSVDTVVAHNVEFDSKVVQAEGYRAGLGDILEGKKLVCTMLMGEIQFNLSKWPKLVDLYTLCFGSKPVTQLHRADNDTEVCAQIYFHIQN